MFLLFLVASCGFKLSIQLYVQMSGLWLEVGRTRFTFNTMESVLSTYTFDPATNTLEGLFIGTL
jgi:hypothetical protein